MFSSATVFRLQVVRIRMSRHSDFAGAGYNGGSDQSAAGGTEMEFIGIEWSVPRPAADPDGQLQSRFSPLWRPLAGGLKNTNIGSGIEVKTGSVT